MEQLNIFRDPRFWGTPTITLNSIDTYHFRLDERDYSLHVTKDPYLHAIALAFLSKDSIGSGHIVIRGAKDIKELLGPHHISDAHNPALWKHALIVEGKSESFVYEEALNLIDPNHSPEDQFTRWTGFAKYIDFLRSPYMLST